MAYEIIKEIGKEITATERRESYLVKLDTPTICRLSKTYDLYETTHVVVESMQILEDGATYSETHVVAANQSGVPQDSILYQTTRALGIWEAMFAIGYVNTEAEEPDYKEATDAEEL